MNGQIWNLPLCQSGVTLLMSSEHQCRKISERNLWAMNSILHMQVQNSYGLSSTSCCQKGELACHASAIVWNYTNIKIQSPDI